MKVEIDIPDDLFSKIELLCKIANIELKRKLSEIVKNEIIQMIEEIRNII